MQINDSEIVIEDSKIVVSVIENNRETIICSEKSIKALFLVGNIMIVLNDMRLRSVKHKKIETCLALCRMKKGIYNKIFNYALSIFLEDSSIEKYDYEMKVNEDKIEILSKGKNILTSQFLNQLFK